MDKSDTASIFLRSLSLNASLNFRTMQSLGFCFSLLPVIPKRGIEKASVLTRHLGYFYTHPYLAPAIMGSVVKEEESHAWGQGEEITRLKTTFMGPYAALGDHFFWGRWLPFASLVAVTIGFMGSLWASPIFLLLFFPLQWGVRWRGYRAGYRYGKDSYREVDGWRLTERGRLVRRVTMVVLAFSVLWWSSMLPVETAGVRLPMPLIHVFGLAGCLVGVGLVRRGVSPVWVLYGMMGVLSLYMVL